VRETRILVVDDEARMTGVLRAILEGEGYAVVTVASGPEALQELALATYELVITDVGLPGLSGIDLLESVRGLGIKSIVMSGDPRNRERALAASAAAFVQKPFRVEDLVATVRLCLRSS
jgi:DNA-binding response OmpR family regulator